MNDYTYKELSVGDEKEFKTEITEKMMREFLSITGDINPLHNDEKFAQMMGHSRRVVYGMLTASLLSTLAGVYIPGKYSLVHQVETKFVKPVYVGDVLIVTGKVSELNDSFEQMTMKVTITNQNGEKVLRGIMKVGFLYERK